MPKRAIQPSSAEERKQFAKGIGERRERGALDRAWEESGIDPHDLVGMSPTMGMTKFLTKGAPDIARRITGTKTFIDKMRSMGPSYENAATLFAERYPRVAAHIDPSSAKIKGTKGRTFLGQEGTKTPVQFNPEYAKDAEETLLHEATHVAQGLGDPSTRALYYNVDRALTPRVGIKAAYELNPYEESARSVARRKMGSSEKPFMAKRATEEIVKKLPPGSEERRTLASLMRR